MAETSLSDAHHHADLPAVFLGWNAEELQALAIALAVRAVWIAGFAVIGLTAAFAASTAATPATASHSSTWSPRISPAVAAAPARNPPLPVEVSSAKVPGPGSARNNRIAAQKAP